MEDIAPSLKCLIEIHSALQNGEPIRIGVLRFLQHAPTSDEFAAQLRAIIFAWDQGHDWRSNLASIESPQRRALCELIIAGLSGQTVLPHLDELKLEINRACELEIKRFTDMLPIKMLAPLLLFQFPAFLLLLFGPLLSRFVQELSQ